MNYLVVLWLLFLFGGRIISALSSSKGRNRPSTPVERQQVELGQLQPTHSTQNINETFIEKSNRESDARTKIRNAATLQSRSNKTRNEGAASKRNHSARMQQEQVRKSKTLGNRGKFSGSVKDYIESMGGSFSDETHQSADAELASVPRVNQLKGQGNEYGMSMGKLDDIDWDNYEADFMKESDWSDDFDELDGINQVLLDREQVAKIEGTPLETSQNVQPRSWRQAIVTSEILAKPKAARHR